MDEADGPRRERKKRNIGDRVSAEELFRNANLIGYLTTIRSLCPSVESDSRYRRVRTLRKRLCVSSPLQADVVLVHRLARTMTMKKTHTDTQTQTHRHTHAHTGLVVDLGQLLAASKGEARPRGIRLAHVQSKSFELEPPHPEKKRCKKKRKAK